MSFARTLNNINKNKPSDFHSEFLCLGYGVFLDCHQASIYDHVREIQILVTELCHRPALDGGQGLSLIHI